VSELRCVFTQRKAFRCWAIPSSKWCMSNGLTM